MKIEGPGQLLRIHIGESDRWEGRPLYEAIVRAAREQGLAGATVLRGVEGFGANSRIHTVKILRLSEDLPIVVEIIDQADRIERFLPTLDKMVSEGLVTLEKVNVLIYRHNSTADVGTTNASDDELELESPEESPASDSTEAFAQSAAPIRHIIDLAKKEAAESHHVFIDSVHVLLAMLTESGGIAAQTLDDLEIDKKVVRKNLRAEVTREPPSHEYLATLDNKSRTAANWLGHRVVGPEHLLLALCETRPSAATDILMRLNVQPRDVCHSVLRILGHAEDWQRWLADHPDM